MSFFSRVEAARLFKILTEIVRKHTINVTNLCDTQPEPFQVLTRVWMITMDQFAIEGVQAAALMRSPDMACEWVKWPAIVEDFEPAMDIMASLIAIHAIKDFRKLKDYAKLNAAMEPLLRTPTATLNERFKQRNPSAYKAFEYDLKKAPFGPSESEKYYLEIRPSQAN